MATRKTMKGKAKTAKRAVRRRRKGRTFSGVVGIVQRARDTAASALKELRSEIAAAEARLEKLVAAERDFVLELGGAVTGQTPRKTNRAPGRKKGTAKRRPARRKGPTKADTFFPKLPETFSIDDVRSVAGKLAGVSLAQWSRAGKIRKLAGGGYKKTALARAARPEKK